MEGIWPFRFSRRADASAVPMDRDFAPLFNFLAQPPQVFDGTIPVPAPVAPKPAQSAPVAKPATLKSVAAPAKAPVAVAASGLLRQLRAAGTALSNARRRVVRAATIAPRARSTKVERVRVWMDLDELAISVVRTDARPATAADAAEWMLRLNFLFDGEAWLGDRDDLRLLGGVGVRKVRRGE